MRFTPKSERELQEERLLPEGVYNFEVAEAEDAVSKKGNEMIAVTLRVFSDSGRALLVDDYLMEAMLFKLLHFCEATGLSAKYAAGTLEAQDCIGRGGKVKLAHEEKGGFPPRNVVKDYVTAEAGASTAPQQPAAPRQAPAYDPGPTPDDEIPF
jgi:hypothetical protein